MYIDTNYQFGYNDTLRVFAIDPSSSSTGFVVLDVNLVDWSIAVVYAQTYYRTHMLKSMRWQAEVYGEMETAVIGYGRAVSELLTIWRPSTVICESPYLGRLPQAFRALTMVQTSIRDAVYRYDHTLNLDLIDPASVKKYMGVSGKSNDKSLMTTALLNTALPLTYANGVSPLELDEHCIDAICVGLFTIGNYKKIMQ